MKNLFVLFLLTFQLFSLSGKIKPGNLSEQGTCFSGSCLLKPVTLASILPADPERRGAAEPPSA